MHELLSQPLPWYLAGPLIGLMVPLLLWVGNRQFGMSANFRTLCAVTLPKRPSFFHYDWKRTGLWNLIFVAGVLIGGYLGGQVFANPEPVAISQATRADLAALGVSHAPGMVPPDLFSFERLATPAGLMLIVLGGLLVGFGTSYAGGCTSGHCISGLADKQLPSLIAMMGFFAGGLLATFILLPRILGG